MGPDEAALYETLGANLRRLRRRRRWTQEDAAHACNLPVRTYGRIETGRSGFRSAILVRLAAGFGVAPWRLLR